VSSFSADEEQGGSKMPVLMHQSEHHKKCDGENTGSFGTYEMVKMSSVFTSRGDLGSSNCFHPRRS
jgi:hypothetical protein